MYGENEVNDYHLLKYSLVYDFFLRFSSIKLYGLPIAQCILLRFLGHIQPYVDENLSNVALIRKLRRQNRFQTMGDINEQLLSFEDIPSVSMVKNRKSILLADEYSNLARDQFIGYHVTLFGVRDKDCYQHLPQEFSSYIFRDEILKVLPGDVQLERQELIKQITQKLQSLKNHPYFGTEEFQSWFPKAALSVIKWVYILEKLIHQTKPSIIVIPSEASLFGAIFGLLAKKYQIPYVNAPVVTIGDQVLIPSRANYYLVWGGNQKQWLMDRKIHPTKIMEVGNSGFFYEKKEATQSKEVFRHTLNIPQEHLIIGFTSQPFFETNNQIERWIQALPSNLSVTIVLKKHRNDQYEYAGLKSNKRVKILPSSYPLYDVLHHVDVLMTIGSTTAFEAAIIGKPLLILQPIIPYHYKLSHNELNAHLAKAKAGGVVKNEKELYEQVNRLITQPSYLNELMELRDTFLENTFVTQTNAPALLRTHIKQIIMRHSQ
ncbi:CDP-glycerol glycerophosphotransferase family protein [Bacillus sp. CGMCC 1.16541]|uniref:CDP-glycerol glycerophosphotransferase family protein n=1 Tax=Bacillus sp. CGMCC 1.16541 TaxID=2185143 RepID=UPI000D7259B6|nr:CDP-glycerol glycerophosphotransferase family protein [Bacillus sp. CGMCC 1.16541]